MNRIYHPSEKKPNKRPNKQTNDTKTITSTCLQHIFDIICLNLQEHSFVNIFKTFLLTFLLEIEYKKKRNARRTISMLYCFVTRNSL